MGKLDAELRSSGAAAEINDAPERRFGLVRIKPHAAVGDAAVTLHMGRLDNDETGARIRQHAEMGNVPIGGATVDGAVLTHGSDDDAIGQLDAAKLDRGKQNACHEIRTARGDTEDSGISIAAAGATCVLRRRAIRQIVISRSFPELSEAEAGHWLEMKTQRPIAP